MNLVHPKMENSIVSGQKHFLAIFVIFRQTKDVVVGFLRILLTERTGKCENTELS